MIVVIIGNFIILKLFIAIMIFNFAEASEEIDNEDKTKKNNKNKSDTKVHPINENSQTVAMT